MTVILSYYSPVHLGELSLRGGVRRLFNGLKGGLISELLHWLIDWLWFVGPGGCLPFGVQWSEWLCFLLSFVEKFAIHSLVCLLWYTPKMPPSFQPRVWWLCVGWISASSSMNLPCWLLHSFLVEVDYRIFSKTHWKSVSAVSNCAKMCFRHSVKCRLTLLCIQFYCCPCSVECHVVTQFLRVICGVSYYCH